MTVSIDPSDVRRQAAVKRPFPAPRRSLIVGGLGCAGLLAFTFGAFSFFSGLADPRARTPRPAVVAANMPDLKDGLPALVADKAADAKPTVLNLPRPPAPDAPVPEATRTELRPVEDAAPAAQPRAAEATGSLVPVPTRSAKPAPAIENATTVSAAPKQAALIGPAKFASPLAPAKAETIRAKAIETRNAALPAPPAASPSAETKGASPMTRQSAKSAKPKTVTPVAEDAPVPASAPVKQASAGEESDGLGAKLQSGLKAIGGMFGGDDE